MGNKKKRNKKTKSTILSKRKETGKTKDLALKRFLFELLGDS